MNRAIYPGSFDPITNGHIDILKRSLNVFDEVVILIADNPNKSSKFTVEERVLMAKEAIKELGLKNVSVDTTRGLVVEYAKSHDAKCMIRGLRAVSDFEYEFQLTAANYYIDNSIDIVFFMSHSETNFISSSAIHELYLSKVDISKLVPNSVLKVYQKKYR